MTARPTLPRSLVAAACLLVLAVCREDQDPTGSPASSGTTAGPVTPVTNTPVADSSGGSPESGCIDDYHGNQSFETALELALDTTETAFVVLGDGLVDGPPETGSDALVVCSAAPSDFFIFTAQCSGYLSVEARELDNGVPELLLYAPNGSLLQQALGTWHGFFLKPMQRGLDDGSYVIEVRLRSGLDLQRHGLTVAWLPRSPCPA